LLKGKCEDENEDRFYFFTYLEFFTYFERSKDLIVELDEPFFNIQIITSASGEFHINTLIL